MHFKFATASNIVFGPGTIASVSDMTAPLGNRAFVVTDSRERVGFLLDDLSAKNINSSIFLVEKEPEINTIELATRKYGACDCNLVIGFGGGSALDTGKAVAALVAQSGNLFDYLEIVGAGRPLQTPSISYLAIPTTAGTGSEVTRNAVISVPEKRVKVSIRSPFLLPRIAIIDPELTFSMSPELTATTGLDALTQLIEPFVSTVPTPLTDSLCRNGISRIANSLRQAFVNPIDSQARTEMSLASMFGGMALANSRLGAVHGLAGPIGGMYPAPHGAICARLLPFVMEANILALQERMSASPALARYEEVSRLLTGNPRSNVKDGIYWLHELLKDLDIQPLAKFGLALEEFPQIAAQAQKSSSMKGNPIQLTEVEIIGILEKAF